MNLLDTHYLWASLVWGAIGSGYLLYGWRQKSVFPTLGGLAVVVESYMIGSWWVMSLVVMATIGLTHLLLRRWG